MGRKSNRTKSGNTNGGRRVSFNLPDETSHSASHSYTSVAKDVTNPNNSHKVRLKWTWPRTIFLSAALFVTLPKLVYRAVGVYCPKDAPCGSLTGEGLCRVTNIVIEKYERYVPYSHFLLGIDDHIGKNVNELKAQAVVQPNEDVTKKGILKRVVDRHREIRKKNRQRKGKRTHLLHHLLEEASTFTHWKNTKKQQQNQIKINENKTSVHVDWNKWKYAMSDDFQLSSYQVGLIKELANRVLLTSKNNNIATDGNVESNAAMPTKIFSERVDSVPWGGVYNKDVTRWWPRKDNTRKVSKSSDGARLLAAYLKIMKWPKDLHVKFPFKLCPKGCDSEVAILHTLEWREKYLPWCISPKAIQYNRAGFIYHRGHSRAGPEQRLEAESTKDIAYLNNVGHSMVWYRPAKANLDDPELYIRSLIYTLEAAVTDSLLRNKGEIGRFNLVLDCDNVGTKSIPSMIYVKKLFTFLQDHFPDRLGVLLLANLSGVGRMIMNMVMPFVTEDVKAKIHIIPAGQEKREEMLTQFIDLEHVPSYIGGKDDYVFDANEYYHGSIGGSEKCVLDEDKIREYIQTMPYHA